MGSKYCAIAFSFVLIVNSISPVFAQDATTAATTSAEAATEAAEAAAAAEMATTAATAAETAAAAAATAELTATAAAVATMTATATAATNMAAVAASQLAATAAMAGAAAIPQGFNLDLSAVTATMAAHNEVPTTIYMGGEINSTGIVQGGMASVVNPGQMLTPAQYIALSQVLTSGSQTLVLDHGGNAAAGFVTLTPTIAAELASLVLPANVSINSVGYTAATPFSVTNAGVVNGSLYALQQAANTASVLNFGSLSIGSTGLVSGFLPSYTQALPGVMQSGAMNINVAGALNNAGTIASPGALNISALGAIYNQALAGIQASMTGTSVSLYSAAGSIVNTGIITATQGNLSMATALAKSLAVSNVNGTLSALNGSINMGSVSEIAKVNLALTGGDVLTKQLNLYSGDGKVTVNVNDLQGRVNVNAGAAFVVASTNNLQIGNMNLTGDPAFYNTQVNGDVTISGNLVFGGQDLAIVASRNVITDTGAGSISTASGSAAGGQITIVAGANVTASSSSGPAAPNEVQPPTPDPNDANITLTIIGGSPSGGKIDLTLGDPITSLDSSSTFSNGGNINLIAFAGSEGDSGTITLPGSVTVTTGGLGSNNNGDVNIIAGATASTPVSIGPIDTTGGNSATGNISIFYAQPGVTDGGGCAPCVTITGGTPTGGAFTITTPVGTPPTVAVSDLNIFTNTGVTIASFGTLHLGSIVTNGGNLFVVTEQDITTSGTAGTIDTSAINGSGRNGGHIHFLAGANISPTGTPAAPNVVVNTINVDNGSSTGGKIDLETGTAITSLISQSDLSTNGTSGGYIDLFAYLGSSPDSGTILTPAGVTITSSGGDGGRGRNVTILARNATVNPTIFIGGILITNVNNRNFNGDSSNISIKGEQPEGNANIRGGDYVSGGVGGSSNRGRISILTGELALTTTNAVFAQNNIVLDAGINAFNFSETSNVFVNGNITGYNTKLEINQTNNTTEFQIGAGAVGSGVGGTINLNGLTFSSGSNGGNRNGGEIKITNAGTSGINLLNYTELTAAAEPSGSGGTIRLLAQASFFSGTITSPGGPLTLPAAPSGQGLSVDGSGQVAGTIELAGSPIVLNGTSNFTLSANGPASNGQGRIFVSSTGSTNNLSIGSGNGQLSLSATGSNAIIRLTAGRDLSVDISAITTTTTGPFGNNFEWTGGRDMFVNGTINAGQAGFVQLSVNSSTVFTVGSGTSTNGVDGQILATNGSAGGTIKLINNGTGGINILSPDDLQVKPTSDGTTFAGGEFYFETLNGDLTIGSGTLSVSAQPNTFTAGLIQLRAKNLFLTGPTPVVLEANGQSTVPGRGNNGTIIVQTTDATNDVEIGSNGGQLFISAFGHDSGGSVDIRIGNNLTVDTSSMAYDSGAVLTLRSGNGASGSTLTINGNLVDDGSAATDINLLAGTAGGNTGAIILNGNITAANSNSSLSMTGSEIDFVGQTIEADLIEIMPSGSNVLILIGTATKQPGFNITLGEITNITTSELNIGNYSNSGTITIANDIDYTTGNIGSLKFWSADSYNGVSTTSTIGNRDYFVQVQHALTTGSIIGSQSDIRLTTFHPLGSVDEDLIVSGPVTVTGSGTVLLSSGINSTLQLNANVGGGAAVNIELSANTDATQAAGTVTGSLVDIFGTGIFGAPGSSINIDAETFTAVTTGSIYVNNIGSSPLTAGAAVVGGVYFLTSDTDITTSAAISATQVFLQTNSGTNSSITLSAGITGTSTTDISVGLSADGSGDIVQTNGQLIGPEILLLSGIGNIGGSGSAAIETVTDILRASTTCEGLVFVANTGGLELLDSEAGNTFSLTATGNIIVNSLFVENGPLTISTTTGGVFFNSASSLFTRNGNITLQTTDTVAGFINIGNATTMEASGPLSSQGNVLVVIGAVPVSPVVGTQPANVITEELGGGQIYFGTNGITANSPDNFISTDGKNVIFSSGSLPAANIVLDGDVIITAAPFSSSIANLDLTNPSTVAQIQYLQNRGIVGGTLISSGGIATGGNVILAPGNIDPVISSEVIPANVTVRFLDFDNTTPVVIDCALCNQTPSPVVIAGSHLFSATSGTSDAIFVILNNGLPDALTVTGAIGSGRLNSDGTLTIVVDGGINTTNALISSPDGLGILANGSVTVNGTIGSANGPVLIQTALGSNGNVLISQFSRIIGDIVAIDLDGTGSISSGTIEAPSGISITTNLGNIGTLLTPLSLETNFLEISTGAGASAYFSNGVSPLTVLSISVGDVLRFASGPLAIAGDITANNIEIFSQSVNIGANITASGAGNSIIINNTSGDIVQALTTTAITTDSLTIRSTQGGELNIGSLSDPLRTAASNINILASGEAYIWQSGPVTLTNPSGPSNFVGEYFFNVDDNVTLGNFSSESLVLATTSGGIQVSAGANIQAIDTTGTASIILTSLDTVNGFVNIGANANISAASFLPETAEVYITIGAPVLVRGTEPANVQANELNGGLIYFGANGIVAAAPLNRITANASTIVFDTGSLGPNSISLNGNAFITAASTNPPPPPQPPSTESACADCRSASLFGFGSSRTQTPQGALLNSIGGSRVATDNTPFDESPVTTANQSNFNPNPHGIQFTPWNPTVIRPGEKFANSNRNAEETQEEIANQGGLLSQGGGGGGFDGGTDGGDYGYHEVSGDGMLPPDAGSNEFSFNGGLFGPSAPTPGKNAAPAKPGSSSPSPKASTPPAPVQGGGMIPPPSPPPPSVSGLNCVGNAPEQSRSQIANNASNTQQTNSGNGGSKVTPANTKPNPLPWEQPAHAIPVNDPDSPTGLSDYDQSTQQLTPINPDGSVYYPPSTSNDSIVGPVETLQDTLDKQDNRLPKAATITAGILGGAALGIRGGPWFALGGAIVGGAIGFFIGKGLMTKIEVASSWKNNSLNSATATNPPSTQMSLDAHKASFDKPDNSLLLMPKDKNTLVQIDGATISIKSNALVFVIKEQHTTSIYNLNSAKSNGVSILTDTQIVNIPSGKQALITNQQNSSFSDINPGRGIGYRKPEGQLLKNGYKFYMADFSIPSAILSIAPLRSMLGSNDHQEKVLIHKLLKDATILTELSSVDGPFKVTP